MQTSHPLYHFLRNLLKASYNDLGVKLRIHDITLKEYQQAVDWADRDIGKIHGHLRDVARICKRDNENPANYFESSIWVDYVSNNLDHIDLGSWQRYLNAMTGRSLMDTLQSLSVRVDKTTDTHVPEKEVFWEIKETMLRASKIQVERGIRGYEKSDTTHDAKIYYLINSLRSKRDSGELSLGYNTYLLTLDGSLVHFRKLYRIPLTETYFIYPNQWYELTFPFLRIPVSENPGFAAGLTSLVFSGAFPTLPSLIPIELCAYVFDLGGKDLPIDSVRNVVERSVEERLIECLDPAFEDERRKEEAALRVQRMIVEEKLRAEETFQEIEEAERKTEALREERLHLETSVEELKATKERLTAEIDEREADIEEYGGIDAKIETIKSEYGEQLAQLRANYTAELQEKDERLEGVENTVRSIEQRLEQDQEERKRSEQERAKRMLTVKKSIVTGVMLFGLLFALILLAQFNASMLWILLSIGLMSLGLAFYHWLSSSVPSFVVYGLGIATAGGVILIENRLAIWLWVIPMAWEILVFGIDRLIGKQISEQ